MAKALTQINQVELRYIRPSFSTLPEISYPSVAIETLRSVVDTGKLDLKEYTWILLLTADNRLLGISEINSGTITGGIMNIREVMQLALLSNAVGIILIHNHPSGSLNPSKKDIESTKKIKELGLVMDIHLRDHLIITSEDYVSIPFE